MEQQQPVHHYHLITAEIFFQHKKSEEVMTTRLNGILADPGRKIPVQLLGKAQQIVQLQFFRTMGEDAKDIKVLNCVIVNFSYLGEFTSTEFHADPEGTKKQEVQPEQPTAPIPTDSLKLSVIDGGKSLEDAIKEAK